MGEFKREVFVKPAYAVSGMSYPAEIWFVVIGERGRLQIGFQTGWTADETRPPKALTMAWMAADATKPGGSTYPEQAWLTGLVGGGTEWVWPRLERYYAHVFRGADKPKVDWPGQAERSWTPTRP